MGGLSYLTRMQENKTGDSLGKIHTMFLFSPPPPQRSMRILDLHITQRDFLGTLTSNTNDIITICIQSQKCSFLWLTKGIKIQRDFFFCFIRASVSKTTYVKIPTCLFFSQIFPYKTQCPLL